jgi:hypothetical protein
MAGIRIRSFEEQLVAEQKLELYRQLKTDKASIEAVVTAALANGPARAQVDATSNAVDAWLAVYDELRVLGVEVEELVDLEPLKAGLLQRKVELDRAFINKP